MMKCPRCNSQRVVTGRYLDQIGIGIAPVFRPKELRLFALRGTSDVGIKQGDKFTACVDCGLLWSEIDTKKLTKVLASRGNKKIKQRMGWAEQGIG